MLSFKDISDLFVKIEQDLIASLKRNLAGHRKWEKTEGFDWPAWQAEKLKHIDAFRRDNQKIMTEYSDEIDQNTRLLLGEQFLEGAQLDEKAEAAGHVREPSEENFFGINEPRLESLIDDIRQSEETAEKAALRMMDDVYRRTVYQAQAAMAAGATTLPQAIDTAVKDFLQRGINCIEYKNGARVNIADYVQMALRTAATRSYLQGEARRREQLGVDTVLVSQYGACSKTCLPWQGRVYIDDVWGEFRGEVSGDRGKSINGKWYPLLSVAVKAGLFHPNCRHTVTTWYEGISKLPDPMDTAKIAENSELERKQRVLEQRIRTYKRMAAGLQQPELVKEYKHKAAAAQSKLKRFIFNHYDVLRRDYWREKAYDIPIDKSIKDAILKKSIRGEKINFPPRPIDVDKLSFDAEHINQQRLHGVSEEEAKNYIRNAIISVTKWRGQFERYYSTAGAAYVSTGDNLIRTAFKAKQFDDEVRRTLEVAKELGRK